MINRFKEIVILFFLFSLSACVSKAPTGLNRTCSFANAHDNYETYEASSDALNEFSVGNFHLIRVADGIGPSSPGLDMLETLSTNDVLCLRKSLQTEKEVILWVGADYEFCKERNRLSEKATSYAGSFNKSMLTLMIKKGLHNCETSN